MCRRSSDAMNDALLCRYLSKDSFGVDVRDAAFANRLFVSLESRMRVVAFKPASATSNCWKNMLRTDSMKRERRTLPRDLVALRASSPCFQRWIASSRGTSTARRTWSYWSRAAISSMSADCGFSALGSEPTPLCSSNRFFASVAFWRD